MCQLKILVIAWLQFPGIEENPLTGVSIPDRGLPEEMTTPHPETY